MEIGVLTEALDPAPKSVEVEPKHVHEVATIQHQKIQEHHVLVQALTHRVAILRVAQVSDFQIVKKNEEPVLRKEILFKKLLILIKEGSLLGRYSILSEV